MLPLSNRLYLFSISQNRFAQDDATVLFKNIKTINLHMQTYMYQNRFAQDDDTVLFNNRKTLTCVCKHTCIKEIATTNTQQRAHEHW